MKKFLLLTLITTQAHAINIQSFNFGLDTKYATSEGAFIPDESVASHNFLFVSSYNYTKNPLVETNSEKTEKINVLVERFNTLNLGGSYKFGQKYSLGVQTFASELKGASISNSQTVLGDTTISFKTLVANYGGTTQFAIMPSLKLPTGNKEKFTGDGQIGAGITGILESDFSLFSTSLNLGYKYNKSATYRSMDYGQMALASLGLSVPLPYQTSVSAELTSALALKKSDGSNPGEVSFSARHQYNKQVGLWAGVGVGNLDKWNSNDFNGFIGLRWTPEEKPAAIYTAAPVPAPAPASHIVESPAIVEQKKYGQIFLNENVYFENDKFSINRRASDALKKITNSIKKNHDVITKVVIEGYSSQPGGDDYNDTLSKARAEQVKSFLVKNNISPELLDIVGYGKTRLADPNNAALNRRVEFRIYQKNL